MMRFRESVWDDSELTYAPCMRQERSRFTWVAPPKYRAAGFDLARVPMEGRAGDGNDLERAAYARYLTREMLTWYEKATRGKTPGTWAWLIDRYLNDEYSDFHEVRPSTKEAYRKELKRIEAAIGNVRLSATDFTRLKVWQKNMRSDGRSVSYIKKWFTHWGLALSHGVKLGDADCARIKQIRSEMRIKAPPRRTVYITRDQIGTIVQEADRRGWGFLSLTILIRFELMLRGTDVHGQWEPAEGRKGGIQRRGKIWVDGITWDMIDSSVSRLKKVISKTRDSMPEAYEWDLTAVPDIRRRLLETPKDKRTGPVILSEDGLPPNPDRLARLFKQIVHSTGLPKELQIRDSRAGGITEAQSLVDPYTLQHAAQHTQQSTTDIYARGRSGAANKVVQMRGKR